MLLEDYNLMNKTLFCEKCATTKEYFLGTSSTRENTEFCAGYLIPFGDQINCCPYCKNTELKSVPISNDDFLCLRDVSNCNKQLLNAMIELAEKDPIDYELKMSQFRTQMKEQELIEQQKNNIPHCPTCGSTNIRRISTGSKAAGVAMFGIFSKTAKCQFECLNPNCRYKW